MRGQRGSTFVDTTTLPSAQSYAVTIAPDGADVGSATVSVHSVPADTSATATVGGPAVAVTTTASGQNGRITFSATTGQVVRVSVTADTVSGPDDVAITVAGPDNEELTALNGDVGDFADATVTATGTQTIAVDPFGADTGTITIGRQRPPWYSTRKPPGKDGRRFQWMPRATDGNPDRSDGPNPHHDRRAATRRDRGHRSARRPDRHMWPLPALAPRGRHPVAADRREHGPPRPSALRSLPHGCAHRPGPRQPTAVHLLPTGPRRGARRIRAHAPSARHHAHLTEGARTPGIHPGRDYRLRRARSPGHIPRNYPAPAQPDPVPVARWGRCPGLLQIQPAGGELRGRPGPDLLRQPPTPPRRRAPAAVALRSHPERSRWVGNLRLRSSEPTRHRSRARTGHRRGRLQRRHDQHSEPAARQEPTKTLQLRQHRGPGRPRHRAIQFRPDRPAHQRHHAAHRHPRLHRRRRHRPCLRHRWQRRIQRLPVLRNRRIHPRRHLRRR